MKADDRDIAEYVELNGFCSNEDLVQHFDVSEMTIRRCLDRLETAGRVTRVRAGAIPGTRQRGYGRGLVDNLFREKEQKIAIARNALTLLRGKRTVFLDTGSTCFHLAHLIPDTTELTVITHSLDIVAALRRKRNIRVICPGGELDNTLNVFAGPHAERLLATFSADASFLGVGALDVESGTQENVIVQIPIKTIMNRNATESYLLADSTKFGRRSYFDGIPITELKTIVTTSLTDPAHLDALEAKGLRVEVVPCEGCYEGASEGSQMGAPGSVTQ